ncbi:hypothetical protein GAYE_HTGSCF06PCTG21G0266 [Galdieria yellowstonensis]|uniref:Uncharacterized protein n=1 Tax=Galdieria yellowstonensis TaxID=3028027 RepID=A0AAV9I323_9RHOD|nr:hypothetical protein GAYE_HTGSCF06PCTG21G0266 [Galdieria yellowstonensis]
MLFDRSLAVIVVRGCPSLSFMHVQYSRAPYCKFVIEASQHHKFKLHSGYELSVQYVEPPNLEEFAIWENLSDYPPKLNDEKNEVIDFTSLIRGMIGMLVNLANNFGDSRFEKLASKLTKRIFDYMAKKYKAFVD